MLSLLRAVVRELAAEDGELSDRRIGVGELSSDRGRPGCARPLWRLAALDGAFARRRI
jgi:hypothetical protein